MKGRPERDTPQEWVAGDGENALDGRVDRFLSAHGGRIGHEKPGHAEQESDKHDEDAKVADAAEVVEDRIVTARLCCIIGPAKPDDCGDGRQREKARVRPFADHANDDIAQARAGYEEMDGQKQNGGGNKHAHASSKLGPHWINSAFRENSMSRHHPCEKSGPRGGGREPAV